MNRVPNLTSADIKAWAALIRVVRSLPDGKTGIVGDLQALARKTGGCVAPGKEEAANPFFRLQRSATEYVRAQPAERPEQQPALMALAAECKSILDARMVKPPPNPPPPRRERADIDG